MQDVEIRRAAGADVEGIGVFQTACWQEAYRGLVPDLFLDAMDVEARTAAWRRRVDQREREVVVALSVDRLVGVASWTPGTVDELNTLYVAEEARGTGLAARLLAASIADRPAALWVFSRNTRACRFYAKHGFRPADEYRIDGETGVEEQRLTR